MNYSNAHYGKTLIGRRATLTLLRGRGFRQDRRRLFTDDGQWENVWYKTFSVDPDKNCREAYYTLALLLDDGRIIRDVGAAVLSVDDGSGGCMCQFSSDEESEMDVDDIIAADEENNVALYGREGACAKRIAEVRPLNTMLPGRWPWELEHETAMILKGRWLPRGYAANNAPLPRSLAGILEGAAPESVKDARVLGEIRMEVIPVPQYASFDGHFDILAGRGTRWIECRFGGKKKDGVWLTDYFNVECTTSTGQGSLFFTPTRLRVSRHDFRQACLMLIDLYDDEEFRALSKRGGI